VRRFSGLTAKRARSDRRPPPSLHRRSYKRTRKFQQTSQTYQL